MEDVTNKSFDVNERFGEIEEISNSQITGIQSKYEIIIKELEIVSGLIDIFSSVQNMAKFEITKKVCEIADKISDERDNVWGLSKEEKDGQILISFLTELASKALFLRQIKFLCMVVSFISW